MMKNEREGFQVLLPELTRIAHSRGIDLTSISCKNGFWKDGRILVFCRESGTISYYLQGGVKKLPKTFAKSACEFHGAYSEAGECGSPEEAVDLIVSWLLEMNEADQLPKRTIARCGIG
jgi:hypothetical protein